MRIRHLSPSIAIDFDGSKNKIYIHSEPKIQGYGSVFI
jgi:hypothetical protein